MEETLHSLDELKEHVSAFEETENEEAYAVDEEIYKQYEEVNKQLIFLKDAFETNLELLTYALAELHKTLLKRVASKPKKATEKTGNTTRKKHKFVAEREIANCIGLYKNGVSLNEIARVTKLSKATVSNVTRCYRENTDSFITVEFYRNWYRNTYGRKA